MIFGNLLRYDSLKRAALPLLLGLGGCQVQPPARTAAVVAPANTVAEAAASGWHNVINASESVRLGTIDESWQRAIAAARAGGFARRLRGEGPLLEPGAGQGWAVPSPGSYRCRLFRLGGQGRRAGLQLSGPFFCHVGDEGEQLSLTQQTGPERPGGYLWRDSQRRMVFIGATARGRENVPPAYGNNPARDVVGLFERVAPFRYRLTIPRDGGVLDVLELVPAVPSS